MIRKILVPVRGDGKGDNVLAHAAAIAHRHMSHVVVVHCRPQPEDLMPYGIYIPDFLRKQLVEQSYKLADQEEEGLREELRVLARDLNLDDSGERIGEVATVEFLEVAGRQVDVIKRHGRLADMIAVAKPDRDRNLGKNTLKAALFHSGRPVLMCPPRPTPPETLAAKVAIAWNGSAESARALAQCKSVLRGADTIWVLTDGTDAGPGTTIDDLKLYLALHHMEVTVETFSSRAKAGAEMLRVTAELGADMLIMGAYGESHERETVFGGNTQIVVDTAMVPVLLNH